MKLYSPQFEKSLRRSVKKAIRSSPELKREYKRLARIPITRLPSWLTLGMVTFIAACFPALRVLSSKDASSGLAELNILAAFAAVYATAALWSRLDGSEDLHPLFLLPIDDSAIFRWEIRQALKSQLLSLLLLLEGLAGIGSALDFSLAKYLALIPIGLLAWLTQLAVVPLCAAHIPRRLVQFLGISGILIPIFLLFTFGSLHREEVTVFEECVPSLNSLLPSSWPLSLFQFLLPEPRWIQLALLLPMGILFCTVPSSLRLLLRDFGFREKSWRFDPEMFADLIPAMPPGAPSADAASPPPPESKETAPIHPILPIPVPPRHLSQPAIADIILSRQFLAPPVWPSRGLMERWLWRWLNKRGKALAELVAPDGFIALSSCWRKVFRTVLIVAAAGLLTGVVNDVAKYWVIGIGFAVATIQALATLLSSGNAFRVVSSSGVNIPICAGLGIGFDELSKFLMKFSLVQLPALLGFTIALAYTMFYLVRGLFFDTVGAIGPAFRLAFLMLACRFFATTYWFCISSNATSGFRVRTVLLWFAIISSVCFFPMAGLFGLILPRWWGWPFCGLAALDAFALYRFCRWFYHRNSFDLIIRK
jgi:hypothetical protein